MSIYYIIPARRNSKGLLFKNRFLLESTLQTISSNKDNIIITTDDEWILEKAKRLDITTRERPKELAEDDTSHKDVLNDVVNFFSLQPEDIIVYLYLTYPQRTRKNIDDVMDFFINNDCDSLLCKKDITTTPYLMMYELPDNKGEKVIDCELWRRQDYRKCFERSHFVVIFKVKEINNLNDFLWNSNTKFYPIFSALDVDTKKDLDDFLGEKREICR